MPEWTIADVIVGLITGLGITGAILHRLGLMPYTARRLERKRKMEDSTCPAPNCKQELKQEIQQVKQQQSANHDDLIVLKEGQKTLFKRLDTFENKLDDAVKGVNTLCGMMKKGGGGG